MVAAGGTGGHLFPAEALSVALAGRGVAVELATDERASRYGHTFPARATHLIPSATIRGRDPLSLARTAATLTLGVSKAWLVLGRARPAVVVGFGGYPSIPPVLAATLRGIPTVIHEQNGVMGRANRFLAKRVIAIATGFSGVTDRDSVLAAKATHVGNPVRPAIIEAAKVPYVVPGAGGRLNLLVFGGSQGARVMADIVPPAIEALDPSLRARLSVIQQAREEDAARVQTAYARLGIEAEVTPFFADLPARMAASHMVISRSGASTVAELAAIGRPAFLVPLPTALDQDQHANASALEQVGGAILITQDDFTPARLASDIAALMNAPDRLAAMAAAARTAGTIDAADRLAELVLKVAGVLPATH
ncbi:MAG: undecaprenyldiphospho-muramoylpentapeptide beta-N-acetylglucosaminyltransferase [Rhizobiales bacterium]|nr:undecaprenyldiphospho-muramoylpentapeptide beta-N-acetylglucosaminyltransferase [Hyphomicrobiales bacterium]